mgnify:CR=1 FL=1
MSRKTKFNPVRNLETGKWRINIPAKYSETGKRQRLEFQTKALATLEANRRIADINLNGTNVVPIAADRAAEANNCYKLLENYNVTLIQVVNEWLQHKTTQNNSITLDNAFLSTIALRKKENKASSTIREYKATHKLLPLSLLNKKVCDITLQECSKVLDELTSSPSMYNKHRAYLRAVFNEAERDGYNSKNPVEKTRKRKTAPKLVEVCKVEDINNIFAACVDYRGQYHNARDCSDCVIAFAFAAFAGIRPSEQGELGRLTWEDVCLENRNIRIPAAKSKTRTLRNVYIEYNLLAFINTVPEKLRYGRIVPGAWHTKKSQVMSAVGLKGKVDILRHSYGSFHLAHYGDVNLLGQNMGHAHMSTYFDHYHNARTTKEALAYWAIYPKGMKGKQLKVV